MSEKYITSKSKTFKEGSGIENIIEWFFDKIETEDIEIITNTPPSYDVETRCKQKYKITITNLK